MWMTLSEPCHQFSFAFWDFDLIFKTVDGTNLSLYKSAAEWTKFCILACMVAMIKRADYPLFTKGVTEKGGRNIYLFYVLVTG